MNEIKNLTNFKSSVADQGYIYCDLHSGDGKKILSRNRLKNDFDGNLGKIIKKINSTNTANGSYLIRCYIAPNSEGEIYCYHKGGVSTLGENNNPGRVVIMQKEKESPANNVLSYSSALSYQNDINKLTYEKALLEKEIIELKAQLKDWEENYEEVDEEEETTLSEPKKDFASTLKELFESISATALPILDRHYTIKEQSLELELMKMGAKPKTARPNPATSRPNPEMEQRKAALVSNIEAFLDAVDEEDPDHYDELENLSTQTGSLEEWLAKVKELYPGTYEKMETFIQQQNAA